MKPFDCLSDDQSIHGKIFIEASAGTGKTFAIEHIVRRLLLEGKPLKEILITTFTKKGVRDLKRRIYENIKDALKNVDLSDEQRLTLENQMALINEAEIHTIHSFCHRSLSEFAFEAGISLNSEDPESDEKKQEVQGAILDTLRTTLDDQEFSAAQLLRLMSHFMRDVPKLVKKMTNFLEQEAEIESYAPYTEIKKAYDAKLNEIDQSLFKDDLYALAQLYKKCNTRSGELIAPLEKQIQEIGNLEELIKTTPSIFSLLEPGNLKKGKDLTQIKQNYPGLIDQLAPLVKEAADPLITFMRLCKKAQERVDAISMKNPNYLLDAMLTRIERKGFYTCVQKKYSAVIIDEFQDTDPKQWAIFSRLFFDKADPFIVVGDPKQSIYGFRGADLATYLRAREAFDDVYMLATNYRSNQTVIETLNRLFDQEKVQKSLSLPYQEISSGKEQEPNEGVVAAITNEGEEKIMAYIADEICRLTKEEDYKLSDCAVLVKDRYQAEKITHILQEKSIPVLSNATETILDSPAFQFVQLALKLRGSVRNLSLFNQFLLHPFVGIPYTNLTTQLTDPNLEEAITKFSSIDTSISKSDDAAFLRALLNETFYDMPIIKRAEQEGQSISDLMQSIEVIFQTNRTHPLDAIEQLKNKRDLDAPALKKRPLSDHDAVIVMTMHMSKGLEFEVVFPLGVIAPYKTKHEFTKTQEKKVQRFSSRSQESISEIHKLDQEKIRLFYVALTRAKSRLYLPISLQKKATKMGMASSMELFLAAQIATSSITAKELYEQTELLTEECVTELCQKLEIPHTLVDDLTLQHTYRKKDQEEAIIEKCIVTLNEMRRKTTSFSALTQNHKLIKPEIKAKSEDEITPYTEDDETSYAMKEIIESSMEDQVEESEQNIPSGAATGNLVHLIFEKMIEMGTYYPWKENKIRELIENDLRHTHLEDYSADIYDLIYHAFHMPLDGFTLAQIPPYDMLQEAPFLFNVTEETAIKGFADLIVRYQEAFYIIDWKMNTLKEYTQESLEEAMIAHEYKLQATIYREAVQRYTKLFTNPPKVKESYYFFLRGKQNGLYRMPLEALSDQKIKEAIDV